MLPVLYAVMPILAALRHHTAYHYDRPVTLGPQTVRLHPAPHTRTPISSYALTILPEPHTRHWHQDPQGNVLARVFFPEPAARFELLVELTAELADINPFDFFLEPDAATWPFQYPILLSQELMPYRMIEPVRPWSASVLAGLSLTEQPSIDLLVALNQLIHTRVAYLTRMEPGVQSPAHTWESASGSCRDVAWLMVQAARSLGFAARFVSGYLIQLADPEKPVPGLEADGADLHAWAEMYLPGAGWIGFDATSGLITGAGHIPLASSANPEAAAPLSGTVEASATRFDVTMTVTRLPQAQLGSQPSALRISPAR